MFSEKTANSVNNLVNAQGIRIDRKIGQTTINRRSNRESFEFCHFEERQRREILEIMHR